jgi:hypothetical protein
MKVVSVLSVSTQELLISELCSSFHIFNSRVVVNYSEVHAQFLRLVLDGGYSPRKMAERAVHNRLLNIGTVMYQMHLKTKEFPDHLGSHDVFGYFLKHREELIQTVDFDHGETAEEYIKSADGLLESVVEQLLSYKNPEPVTLGKMDDCCCH